MYKEQSLLARKGSGRELRRRRKGTALRAAEAEAEAKAASREREAEVATSDRWPPVGIGRQRIETNRAATSQSVRPGSDLIIYSGEKMKIGGKLA